jgi:hypothetical protein
MYKGNYTHDKERGEGERGEGERERGEGEREGDLLGRGRTSVIPFIPVTKGMRRG